MRVRLGGSRRTILGRATRRERAIGRERATRLERAFRQGDKTGECD